MIGGASDKSPYVELYSLKAGFAVGTHLFPHTIGLNKILQTTPKASKTSNQCDGEEPGTILNIGGTTTTQGLEIIWAYSYQHGWIEVTTDLSGASKTRLDAIVIP